MASLGYTGLCHRCLPCQKSLNFLFMKSEMFRRKSQLLYNNDDDDDVLMIEGQKEKKTNFKLW